MPTPPDFSTRAIHAGEQPDPATRAHATPIYQTAAFSFDTAEDKAATMEAAMAWEGGFFYTRTGNPTTRSLETKLADLEGAEDAVVSSSGMASLAASLFITLEAGDHLVASDDLFIITQLLLRKELRKRGIEVTEIDISDLEEVRSAIRPNTRAILSETVSNPYIQVADIPELSEIASEHSVRLIIDNTFLGPAIFRPLESGADMVVHSATKYLSGHGDTVAGVVAGSTTLMNQIRFEQDVLGSAPSPLNSWLVLRGVRTLALRTEAHCRNALALARMLANHPKVLEVSYPGLETHPQHDTAQRLYHDQFGGMLSFRLHGSAAEMNSFANALTLCELSVSLGDVFTLVYPMPRRNNLIRVSVGCENTDDIISDFERALDAV